MSEIYIDRVSMESRLEALEERAGSINDTLADMPATPDGGETSSLLALIASAAAEAASIAVETQVALAAVTADVLADLHLTEEQIADSIRDLKDEIGGP